MKDVCFIIPYFGHLKNYFPLFLQSCAKNEGFNWLILTDASISGTLPNNVRVISTSFEEIRKKIQKKFKFQIALSSPYKLTDYKPAYGYLFQEYLYGFKFWGYCDTDLIWGKISEFITPEMLKTFDKIGELGHCTLIKNSPETNSAFMRKLHGFTRYEEVFTDERNLSFDEEYEESINNIFQESGFSIYKLQNLANVYAKSSLFKLTNLGNDARYTIEPKKKAFFEWNDGHLKRWALVQNRVRSKEYMYLHLQARAMRVKIPFNSIRYKIIPNSFELIEETKITFQNFQNIKWRHLNFHYFQLRSHNLYDKIRLKINPYYRSR
ncbi:DUF6625 family protein [Lacticaseibacillus paracasei]|uniref:DUF6625 family protein n=1 Tax=Lacticaseibacillus paracasei TaxID=1597 RepID=UPI002B238D1B|nr:DUF6625 family protein [Lacticaseibacillus paracasei]MEB0329408.1 hypothetical protein [Lacticaseibacillus paracasei]